MNGGKYRVFVPRRFLGDKHIYTRNNKMTIKNKEITKELRRLLTTDKAHADNFNELFQVLVENDVILDEKSTNALQKGQVVHDVLNSDYDSIPGADVTANLQNQIDIIEPYITQLKQILKCRKSITSDKNEDGFLIKTHNMENSAELLKVTIVRNGNKFWYGTIGFTTIAEMDANFCTATKNSSVGISSTVSFFNHEGYAYIHIGAAQWTNLVVESTTRSIHSVQHAPIPSGVSVIKTIQIN